MSKEVIQTATSHAQYSRWLALGLTFLAAGTWIMLGTGIQEKQTILREDVILPNQPGIQNGFEDQNTPARNAVVKINGCTGFFVTPQLIFTALHCTNGHSNFNGGNKEGTINIGSDVSIGADSFDFIRTDIKVVGTLPMHEGPLDANEPFWFSKDFAILKVWPPAGSEVVAQKPRMVLNTIGTNEVYAELVIPLRIAGWGRDENSNSPTSRRFNEWSGSNPLTIHQYEPTWVEIWGETNYGTNYGDSGGPLLWLFDPNNLQKVDIIGVTYGPIHESKLEETFGIEYQASVWKNISSPETISWIDGHIPREENNQNKWLGEPDYQYAQIGECDLVRDPDCDGFYDEPGHDNCPGFNNVDQLPGSDFDQDGVLDYCDNCPTVANYDQTDSDLDGVGNACDYGPNTDDFIICDPAHQYDPNDVNSIPDKCQQGAAISPYNRCVPVSLPLFSLPKSNVHRTGPFGSKVGFPNLGRCARSLDADGDRVGDAEDNCPIQANSDQTDTDQDGLGDVCDLCNGKHIWGDQTSDKTQDFCDLRTPGDIFCQNHVGPNSHCKPSAEHPYAASGLCSDTASLFYCNINVNFPKASQGDADCAGTTQNSNSRCVPNPKPPVGDPTKAGVCTIGLDSDSDGIGDSCDGCPSRPNPLGKSPSGSWNNCNLDWELANNVSYPYPTDECDPTPCAYSDGFYSLEHEPITNPTTFTQAIWNITPYTPNILPRGMTFTKADGTQGQSYSYPAPIPGSKAQLSAKVGARFCRCEPKPGEPTESLRCHFTGDCVLLKAEYDADEIDTSWKHVALHSISQPISSYGDPNPTLPPSPAESFFQDDAEGTLVELFNATRLHPASKIVANELEPINQTYMAWDVSKLGPKYPTGLDIVPPQNNQPGSLSGLGIYGVYWTHVVDVPGISATDVDQFRTAANHYHAGFYGYGSKTATFPDPTTKEGECQKPCDQLSFCPQCELFDISGKWLMELINPADPYVHIDINGNSFNMTDKIHQGIRQKLVDDQVIQVSASEPSAWIIEGQLNWAALSMDGTEVSLLATMSQNQWLPTLDGVAVPIGASLPASTPSSSGEIRVSFGAVLSSQEDALFVVGGYNQNGESLPYLQRFSTQTATWQPLAFTGTIPEQVLSVTFRNQDRSLYIVDQTSDGQFGRLLRIDLARMDSMVLGRWTRHATTDKVFLTQTRDSHLLLASSSTRNNEWRILSLLPLEQGGYEASWSASGQGILAWSPSLSKKGLTLPLQTASGTQSSRLPPGEQSSPARFEMDACL
jgi:hypothetical protein